jgi:iron complex outermembrane recepter protein
LRHFGEAALVALLVFCGANPGLAADSDTTTDAAPAPGTAPASGTQKAPTQSSHNRLETVIVTGMADGSAAAGYRVEDANLGPLGDRKAQDTPYSLNAISGDLLYNQQAANISDVVKYDPSVQVEPRGDLDYGRPQSRGFENSVTQNTRIDGLNSYSIMAYPMESFDGLEVLNGAAGALYGASSPGGTFNFILKRPTDEPIKELTVGYISGGYLSEHGELSGYLGDDDWFGYRVNALHGEGESYVAHSGLKRDLLSGDFDIRLSPHTKIELDSYVYDDFESGFPGAFVYGTNATNVQLPSAPDPTKVGYGVKGAGQTLVAYNEAAKLKQDLWGDWHLMAGLLYQYSGRRLNLNGVPADPYNQLTNGNGNYNVYFSDSGLKTEVDSDLLYINGTAETGDIKHDLFFGTNGYQQMQHTRLGQTYLLGAGSIADPVLYDSPTLVNRGTFYKSAYAGQQAIDAGDTITIDPQWSVLAAVSQTWLTALSYSAAGVTTAHYSATGTSPTVSLIYKPQTDITTYFTYADALQQGDTAPLTGVTNPGVILAPYRDQDYELGGKWTLSDNLDLDAALFRMQRPYAYVDPSDSTFKQAGTQTNDGLEVMVRGNLWDDFTLYGGITYLDPMLQNTGNASTSDKQVISVPRYQGNLYAEYRLPMVTGFAINADLHYVDKRAGNVTNTTWAASYVTLDLGGRYRIPDSIWTVRAGVNNVADAHYWAAILPSAQDGASSSYAAFLGAPRMFTTSITADF